LTAAISDSLGRVVEDEQSSELHTKATFYVDDNYLYKIVYFDTQGKERHHKYIHHYCNGATAILYLFDASKRPTFERVEQWINECQQCEPPIQILVGNKIDLVATKKNLVNPVTKTEGLGLAKKYGMEYFETASVGQASVEALFDHLFNSLLGLIQNPPDPESLMGKNVVLGKRVSEDVKFKMALADLLPNYD
jgi:GTPase SAR1 family protein